MAQQGEQMKVGAREGFAYHSVKLVLLAKGNRYGVDSNTFFPSGNKRNFTFRIEPSGKNHKSNFFRKNSSAHPY